MDLRRWSQEFAGNFNACLNRVTNVEQLGDVFSENVNVVTDRVKNLEQCTL